MKINLIGLLPDLQLVVDVLSCELSLVQATDGVPVEIVQTDGPLQVAWDGQKGRICYAEKPHFFRALGLFIEAYQRQAVFDLTEMPQFTKLGVMVDASRNAVPKPASIQRLLRHMALMGLNLLMLYTEDTYQVEGEPYFGYMRGRYTYDELKDLDDYADALGIEIVPCIQTLGHLEQFLKWEAVKELCDTEAVLLIEHEPTYQFIEKMLAAASAPLRSKRIHIGMDEAYGVGLGRYLELHGYPDRFALMLSHLKRVCAIAEQRGLRPMFWGDMPFRLGSPTGKYPDPTAIIPEWAFRELPPNLQFVYWEYLNADEAFHRQVIQQHKVMGILPIFAGGMWNWTGFGTNFGRAFATLGPALRACKSEGVKEAFVTLWADNGAENNLFSTLPGLQFVAEHGYAPDVDLSRLKQRFAFCTGGDWDSFERLKYLDETSIALPDNLDSSNPSKYLLWQDVLMGLFDRHAAGHALNRHYATLEEQIRSERQRNSPWDFVFDVPERLCAVLKVKAELGLEIKQAYDRRDMPLLQTILSEKLPALQDAVEALRVTHREQWFATYKLFGWEVLDIRYGGLLARLDSAIKRLDDFTAGRIQRIEELEEDRLYFEDPEQTRRIGYSVFNRYHRIVTAGAFSN